MSAKKLNHEEAWDALPAAALDALDGPESEALAEHLATCAECRAELEVLRATTAELAVAAPGALEQPSRHTRDRLLARARAGKSVAFIPKPVGRKSEEIPTVPPMRLRQYAVGAAAFAAASLVGVAILGLRDHELSSTLDTMTQIATSMKTHADSLTYELSERDKRLASLSGKDVSLVHMASNQARDAWATMFWNHTTNAWTFVAHNLPAPHPGRVYQLWLVTADAKISAGTFAPTQAGDAVVSATQTLTPGALVAVAVTDEPAGGVQQPTGAMVIAGSAR